jgi:hypothetical protein
MITLKIWDFLIAWTVRLNQLKLLNLRFFPAIYSIWNLCDFFKLCVLWSYAYLINWINFQKWPNIICIKIIFSQECIVLKLFSFVYMHDKIFLEKINYNKQSSMSLSFPLYTIILHLTTTNSAVSQYKLYREHVW